MKHVARVFNLSTVQTLFKSLGSALKERKFLYSSARVLRLSISVPFLVVIVRKSRGIYN